MRMTDTTRALARTERIQDFFREGIPHARELAKLAAEAKRSAITEQLEAERSVRLARAAAINPGAAYGFDDTLEQAVDHKLGHEIDIYESSIFLLLFRAWLDNRDSRPT